MEEENRRLWVVPMRYTGEAREFVWARSREEAIALAMLGDVHREDLVGHLEWAVTGEPELSEDPAESNVLDDPPTGKDRGMETECEWMVPLRCKGTGAALVQARTAEEALERVSKELEEQSKLDRTFSWIIAGEPISPHKE